MVLNGIINITQNRTNAILILRIELQERHHAEIINKLRHCPIKPLERGPTHHTSHRRRIVPIASRPRRHPRRRRRIGRIVVQQTRIGIEEALQLQLADRVLDQIHLAQHVDVRDLEHDHGAHGGQGAGEELGPVDDKGRFQQVGGAQVDVQGAGAGQVADERGQDRDVRVQLDLAGHVDYDQVFFRHGVEGLGEEVEVLEQESGRRRRRRRRSALEMGKTKVVGSRVGRIDIVDVLEAVDEPAVRTQPYLFHDVFERDEIFDVDVGLIDEIFGRRVEVDVEA